MARETNLGAPERRSRHATYGVMLGGSGRYAIISRLWFIRGTFYVKPNMHHICQ